MEHLSNCEHQSGDDPDKCFTTSAATTVVRKTTNISLNPISNKVESRLSDSSDGMKIHSSLFENSNQILTNRHALEEHQRRASMRQSIQKNPLNFSPFQINSSGQQTLFTSSDIEAMTMKQFRMGSLGC